MRLGSDIEIELGIIFFNLKGIFINIFKGVFKIDRDNIEKIIKYY